MLDGEGTEAAKLDPIAARERIDNLVENDIHDTLHIPMIEMWIGRGNFLHQF